MRPTPLGDIAAYTFFSLVSRGLSWRTGTDGGKGGLFIGGEIGVLTGGWSAKRSITSDPAMKQ